MKKDTDSFSDLTQPIFLNEATIILQTLQQLSNQELQSLWKTNDKLTQENIVRLYEMDLYKLLTPAIIAYEGIQYQYMSPDIFTNDELTYIQSNLRILSGLYGVLKPFDGIAPYRLEMQSKLDINGIKGLYNFWAEKIYNEVSDDSKIIINLASKEYAKCVSKYLTSDDRLIDIYFGELKDGRFVQKATYAKMARGEMVRYMAKHNIQTIDPIKAFNELNYTFDSERSNNHQFYFIK